MARFVTAAGVVVETSEKAGRAIGYTPAAEPKKSAPKPAQDKPKSQD